MTELEMYYNKFNEEKRLNTRHGQVEYIISMKYIHKYLEMMEQSREKFEIKILDVGAGTGRYSVPLSEEGYDVTALELVKYNLGILKKKGSSVKAFQGNAMKLKRFEDESFDLTLVFGPMYHLKEEEERLQALKEAKRVTKKDGVILVAYLMNEYAVLRYGFKEKNIKESLKNGQLTSDFHCTKEGNPLYHFMRIEDMDVLNEKVGLTRKQIVAVDGVANLFREVLNALDEEEFKAFVEYQLATCERMDLMGASGHTVDILSK